MIILDKYKITYHNNMVQIKDFVYQKDYDKFKKESTVDNFSKNIEKAFGNNFFTEDSPIGLAIKTKILSLPNHQGCDKKCIVIKL